MVAMILAIGMTGIGSAIVPPADGSFVANGDTDRYYAAYSGTAGGLVHINTYTDDGRDHKTITYDNDMEGWQSVAPGSTNIVRYDEVNGGGQVSTYTRDNGDAVVSTLIKSTNNLKTFQAVTVTSVEAGCVNSYTMGAANAEYSMSVSTSTDDNAKRTSVALAGTGHAEMEADAYAAVGDTDIKFGVGDIVRPFGGPSYGGTNGIGTLTVRTYTDAEQGLGVTGPGTYTFTSNPGTMKYTAPFNGDFEAIGYVYAMTP